MIKTLYHGTLSNFNNFDENYLGKNINDLMSYLGFHFTENKSMARNLFASNIEKSLTGFIFTIEINEYEEKCIIGSELDIIMNILEFGVQHGFVTKSFFNNIKKLPYWDSFGGNSIIKKLYNNGKRPNSTNFINKKELVYNYKKYLLSNNINIIKYKNEIEWSGDNRYDYIILDQNIINIINKEQI